MDRRQNEAQGTLDNLIGGHLLVVRQKHRLPYPTERDAILCVESILRSAWVKDDHSFSRRSTTAKEMKALAPAYPVGLDQSGWKGMGPVKTFRLKIIPVFFVGLAVLKAVLNTDPDRCFCRKAAAMRVGLIA